jgi:hypothetical protein
MTRRPVRIANVSGFYGDRIEAAREMVEGGDVDVLTGDYLAELTMFLLHKARQRDPETGFASTFLTQVEHVLGTCLDRGIRIVSNAGGLNPGGLAERIVALGTRLGLAPRVAWVDGDDVRGILGGLQADGHRLAHLDTGAALADTDVEVLTANAYLGGWPIVHALQADADVVVTGRVTDASLVVGPAAWWHGWSENDWDRLAGAVVAGHVIECGPQATGGNFSFFDEIEDPRYPGFPIAEIADDGSAVITKQPDTGGLVSVDTVTAQLLYEIQSPAYAGPDVIARFDTIRLAQEGPDRVRISGTVGTPPSGDVKVALNYRGGYRNSMTAVITGLDIERKAARAEELVFGRLGGRDSFDAAEVQLLRYDSADARIQAEASAHLVITVKDADPKKVGRRFSNTVTELFLGGYPGFYPTTPPSRESEYGVYWPTLIPGAAVSPTVHHADGSIEVVPCVAGGDAGEARFDEPGVEPETEPAEGSTSLLPLGRLVGARSGDKGGNANVGLWARTDEDYTWLRSWLTTERFAALLPEAEGLPIRRYELPDLRALNFIVVGILGEGVASSTRPDAQAKALAEFVRSRLVPVPDRLIGDRFETVGEAVGPS